MHPFLMSLVDHDLIYFCDLLLGSKRRRICVSEMALLWPAQEGFSVSGMTFAARQPQACQCRFQRQVTSFSVRASIRLVSQSGVSSCPGSGFQQVLCKSAADGHRAHQHEAPLHSVSGEWCCRAQLSDGGFVVLDCRMGNP